MPHLGPYGDELDIVLPTYPLYEEYLANIWPDSGPFMDVWPDQGSVSAQLMDTAPGENTLMIPEAVSAFVQPQSDESTIVVRQTPPEAAGNSEYEDFNFDVIVRTPPLTPGQTGDISDQPGDSTEQAVDSSITCPSPGDLVSHPLIIPPISPFRPF